MEWHQRQRRSAGALVGVVAVVVAASAAEQAPQASPSAAKTAPAAERAKIARTADGKPDLQGVWNYATVTPLERPDALRGKDVFSDDEAEEFARRETEKADHDRNPPADVVGNYNEFWYDGNRRVIATNRTSLIIDPPDGRLPPQTPEAVTREAAIAAARKGVGRHEPTPGGFVEDLGPGGLQVRCILGFNSGPPMTPAAYNQNVQIFQTRDYVVIYNEMVHNARIVPMDGRPHGKLPQWVGDSRGRWDGDTLVVETRNFKRETAFLNGRTTSKLHLTERFTRADADTLLYEFTVNDPNVWTRPWTAQIPMARSDEPIYEYACHEGNLGLVGILGGAHNRETSTAR
jgi:hypothetical protein